MIPSDILASEQLLICSGDLIALSTDARSWLHSRQDKMSYDWQPTAGGAGHGGSFDDLLARMDSRQQRRGSNSHTPSINDGNQPYRPVLSRPPPAPFFPSLYAGQEDDINNLDAFGELKPRASTLSIAYAYRITQTAIFSTLRATALACLVLI